VWDLETGKLQRSLKGHKGHVTAVEWFVSPGTGEDEAAAGASTPLVLTGAQDGHLRVWDLRSESCVANLATHTSDSGSGAVGAIRSTALASGMDKVVTFGADKAVVVHDPRAGFAEAWRWTEHRDFPYSLEVAGPLVFSGDGQGMLLAHDLDSGRLLYVVCVVCVWCGVVSCSVGVVA